MDLAVAANRPSSHILGPRTKSLLAADSIWANFYSVDPPEEQQLDRYKSNTLALISSIDFQASVTWDMHPYFMIARCYTSDFWCLRMSLSLYLLVLQMAKHLHWCPHPFWPTRFGIGLARTGRRGLFSCTAPDGSGSAILLKFETQEFSASKRPVLVFVKALVPNKMKLLKIVKVFQNFKQLHHYQQSTIINHHDSSIMNNRESLTIHQSLWCSQDAHGGQTKGWSASRDALDFIQLVMDGKVSWWHSWKIGCQYELSKRIPTNP